MHSYAYLIAALAFTTPAMIGVRYCLQFTKGLLPLPSDPNNKANATRLYAIVMGAAILPGLAAASAYVGITPVYDIHEAPFDVVAGAAAGLAAILDYHALTFLQGVVSGSVQGLAPAQPDPQPNTVTVASNSVPVPPMVP